MSIIVVYMSIIWVCCFILCHNTLYTIYYSIRYGNKSGNTVYTTAILQPTTATYTTAILYYIIYYSHSTEFINYNLRYSQWLYGSIYHLHAWIPSHIFFRFRVAAVNAEGESDPLETDHKIVAKEPFDPPGKPGKPEVTDWDKEHAELKWDPPTVVKMTENRKGWIHESV